MDLNKADLSMDTVFDNVTTLNKSPTDDGISHTDIAESLIKGIKKTGSLAFEKTTEVTEDISMHKYSRLSNASYDYFNSNGDTKAVETGLSDSKYSYIEDLSGFKVDTELSTLDDLVLFNPKTGETHVSYRGTTDKPLGKSAEFINDWKTNIKIAGGNNNTVRVQEAQTQMEKVIAKYGKGSITLSGHSQGGNISIEMGLRNGIEGHSFNPATNMGQIERLAENGKQIIYKTPLDFASGFAHHPKARPFTKIVNNIVNMDSVLDTHSIDQFAPKVNSIEKGMVKVTRRGLVSSIGKGLGHAVNGAAIGYQAYNDVTRDFEGKGTIAEKTLNTTVDIATDTENFLFTNAIIDTSLALAPETLGLSLVVGYGIHVIHDEIVNEAGSELKSGLVYAGNEIAKGQKTVTKSVKHTLSKIGHFLGW
jgi:hypothetical protein